MGNITTPTPMASDFSRWMQPMPQFQMPQVQIGGPSPLLPQLADGNASSFGFDSSGAANMGGMGYGAPNILGGAAPGAGGGGSIWDSFLSKDGAQGWGNAAAGAAGGIFNAWMGMKQYGLAKDTLETNKQQFAQNFGAQQKTTNARLEDRQNARVASNPGAYQSVGSYMAKNGV